MQNLQDISSFLNDLKNNAVRLSKQQVALNIVNQIEKLKDTQEASKSKEEKDADLLESIEGIGWSKEVFNELDWRMEDARKELINIAQ